MSILDETKALKDRAWEAVTETAAYKQYAALKTAVEDLTLLEHHQFMGTNAPRYAPGAVVTTTAAHHALARTALKNGLTRAFARVSQADAAYAALRDVGIPLSVQFLMDAAIKKYGAVIGGNDPLANFRSALSKDARFHSFTKGGHYYWWLTDVDLPEGWKEKTDPDLLDESVSSASSSQKGGDANAATTAS